MVSMKIAEQLGKPTGLFALVLGWLWNWRNLALNKTVINFLDLKPNDNVLEIGFGGGYLIRRIAISHPEIHITGIDRSSALVTIGKRHFSNLKRFGRVTLQHAVVEKIPFLGDRFNKVCSINSIFYWTDIEQGLQEIHRVLANNGTLVLCFTEKGSIENKKFSGYIKLFETQELVNYINSAGFSDTKVSETNDRYRKYIVITASKQ